MAHIFIENPLQSEGLQLRNLAAPESILVNQLNDTALLRTRKREGETYYRNVKACFYDGTLNVTRDDVSLSDEYNTGCKIALLIPKIAANVNQVALDSFQFMLQDHFNAFNLRFTAIENRFTTIENRFTALENRFTAVENRVFNASASTDEDAIRPPVERADPVPDSFPRTVGQLRNLVPGEVLTTIENYYELGHQGNISKRKSRVRRAYGIGVTTTTKAGPVVTINAD